LPSAPHAHGADGSFSRRREKSNVRSPRPRGGQTRER